MNSPKQIQSIIAILEKDGVPYGILSGPDGDFLEIDGMLCQLTIQTAPLSDLITHQKQPNRRAFMLIAFLIVWVALLTVFLVR